MKQEGVNISSNIIKTNAAYFEPSLEASYHFSSFINNTASSISVIYITKSYKRTSTHNLENCNVMQNKVTDVSLAIIEFSTFTNILKTIFINNNGKYIFKGAVYQKESVTINYCFFDTQITITEYDKDLKIISTADKKFDNKFNYLDTANCYLKDRISVNQYLTCKRSIKAMSIDQVLPLVLITLS